MNIASFLQPKIEVTFLRDDMPMNRALEQLRHSGYSAVPVIDREDRYVGVVSAGDFLWYLLDQKEAETEHEKKRLAQTIVREVIRFGRIKAVCIDTDMDALFEQAKNQNFVPVVDDRNVFIGIVTRRDMINYFVKKTRKED